MSLVRRSIGNLLRSPLRTGGIVVILAASIGLALIMLTVHGATRNQLGSIGEQIGNEITIRPAGSFGPMGGGEPLEEEDIARLYGIEHVAEVQRTIQTQYAGDGLESPIDAGSLGGRGMGRSRETDSGFGTPLAFTMPITIMGFDPATSDPVLAGDARLQITEGRYFAIDEAGADVAVLGAALAEKNGLEVGSQLEIEGVTLEIIGLFDSGQLFGNAMLVLPIGTAQRVFEINGVTSVVVVADDVANVDKVAAVIREIWSQDQADVTTAQESYQRISGAVGSAEDTSRMAMIAGFVVAGVVIMFSVILLMRQRIKEIGILKAIGASNQRIGLQFSLETLVMSLVAAAIGAVLTFPLARSVGNMLVSTPTTSLPGEMARGAGFFGTGGITAVAGIDVAVSPAIFLYALLVAASLAVIASIFPALYISRVKPAEVLRNE